MIRIPDQSSIWMLDLRLVVEWSGIWITIIRTGHFCLVLEWSTSLDHFKIETKFF
jgi:hypothetical protein